MFPLYLLGNNIEFYYTRQVLKNRTNAHETTLTRLSCNILLALCEEQKEVLAHTVIMQKAWGERHREVQYATYYQTVLMLRKSFREIGVKYDVIKTLPRKGLTLDIIAEHQEENTKDKNCEDNITPHSEVHFDEKKNVFPYISRNFIFFAFSILITLSLMLSPIFVQQFISGDNDSFSNNYILAGTAKNHCQYYFNKDTSSHSKNREFMANNYSLCEKNSKLFITVYMTTKTVSAIRCLRSSSSHYENCASYYFPIYQSKTKGRK